MTTWHEAVKYLAKQGTSTITINSRQFEQELKVYHGRTRHWLIVQAFDAIQELRTSESATKHSYVQNAIWLLIFTKDASLEICEFCRNPHGLLNPNFGSKVLISCCDSNIIEEW